MVTTLEEFEFIYCAIREEFSFLIETVRVGGGQGGPWGSTPLGRRETWGEGGKWIPHFPCKMWKWSQIPKVQVGSLKRHPLNQATPGLLPHCPGSPRFIPMNILAGVENCYKTLPNQRGPTWILYPWNTWLLAQQHHKTFLTFSSE